MSVEDVGDGDGGEAVECEDSAGDSPDEWSVANRNVYHCWCLGVPFELWEAGCKKSEVESEHLVSRSRSQPLSDYPVGNPCWSVGLNISGCYLAILNTALYNKKYAAEKRLDNVRHNLCMHSGAQLATRLCMSCPEPYYY